MPPDSSGYRDWKWRAQLFEAALGVDSNIAEGWARRGAAQICVFLEYAHGSLDEARKRLDDGSLQPFIRKSRPRV